MTFDPQAIFANLTEKERVHGHHTAEGRAIRTLCRSLQGWWSGDLGAIDIFAMCDQAIEDWLKSRLKISPWSATGSSQLLAAAVATKLLTPAESLRLQTVHDLRSRSATDAIAAHDVEAALAWSIEVVERHWS
ncbi:MAG TPA: hypothetical protein VK200_10845 [Candidatus Limnocylindrales bacterium]|nr:hypothetical protein [Candidatus Limnocylindrales bacterium]